MRNIQFWTGNAVSFYSLGKLSPRQQLPFVGGSKGSSLAPCLGLPEADAGSLQMFSLSLQFL